MKKKRITALTVIALLTASCFIPQGAFAYSKKDFEYAIEHYQQTPQQYEHDSEAAVQEPSQTSPRFTLDDGIYKNKDAKVTNQATLMITGDLMCQYRQQEAVFQSDGKSYLSYEDVAALMKKIDEEYAQQQAALEEAEKEQTAADSNETTEKDKATEKAPPLLDEADTAKPEETDKNDGTDGTPGTNQAPQDKPEETLPPLNYGKIPQPTGTWDFSESFRYVKDIFSEGDLVIGNLETMLSQSSPLGMQVRKLENKPYLNAPVSYLDALDQAGYDLLTMANNHNCDTGVQGIFETIDHVKDYDFMHTGLFTNKREPRYLIVDVNGIKIGIVAYATYFNQKEDNLTDDGQDTMLNRYNSIVAEADIKAAKKAGAEFILAFMHWGAENTNQQTDNQERNAHSLAKAGADYIIGSHPHALQTYEIIETPDDRQVPVIYSMGNFVSHMNYNVNNDTIILRLNLEKENGKVSVASQRYYPCKVYKDYDEDNYVIVPYAKKYNGGLEGEETVSLMKEAYDRIIKIYGNRMILPLPYTTVKKNKGMSLLPDVSDQFRYIKENII